MQYVKGKGKVGPLKKLLNYPMEQYTGRGFFVSENSALSGV